MISPRLARALVLDEVFDLALYRALRRTAGPDLARILDQLIAIETRHAAFWQEFFGLEIGRLDLFRRVKLVFLTAVCRLLGDPAIHLVVEAIEVYGVRKYLALWERHRGEPLGQALTAILQDELEHEDRMVGGERRLDAESVRSLFLGFNDGLIEILGAVSGFFAAFADTASILVASITVAVAGAFSMGAGAYVAASSEREVTELEAGRRAFRGETATGGAAVPAPLRAALLVGTSYVLGSVVPVLPVALGARTLAVPLLTGAAVALLVSSVLAFLSGMRLARRLTQNVLILGAAVAVTYAIGSLARLVWEIPVD